LDYARGTVKRALLLVMLRFRRTWHVMLILSLIATAIGAVWWKLDFLEISDDEKSAYDDGMKKFTGKPWFEAGKVTRAEDIIVIGIDDQTFVDIKAHEPWRLRYGSWPYARVIWSDVFEYLHKAQAKMVVFDGVMDEPAYDANGDLSLGLTLKETALPVYLGFNVAAKFAPFPQVEAMNLPPKVAQLRAPVEAPKEAKQPATEEEFPDEEQKPPEADAALEKAAKLKKVAQLYAFPVEVRGGIELAHFEKQTERNENGEATGALDKNPVPPIDSLLDTISGWGLVLMEDDDDGKIRKTKFAYTDGTNTYITLPLAAAADALKADKVIIEPGKLILGNHEVPIDADGTASLFFGGTLDERFRTISLSSVLRARSRPDMDALFKDKYVFIGGFALGTADVKATPLENQAPGVLKQLAVFDNIMHRQFITDAPFWVSLLFTFLVCFFSVALVLVVRSFIVDIGWPVILFAGFFVITGGFLVATKIHVLSAMPGLAGTVASVLATAWERLFADKERERLKEMFKFYMETELVDVMVEGKELPALDGASMHITAFFSDIKGFSSFSEKLKEDPPRLMALLNRYLSTVTPALTLHGACIDKYIGDAVVALFGAPIRYSDHALRACRGALEVQKRLADLRTALAAEGLPDVYTRVGLNTDTMYVGNIGSAQLMDYTAIGDGMNLAARLEAANKEYGTLILMGENTYLEVKNHVIAREIDWVRVAGKSVATRIFELLALNSSEVTEAKLAAVDSYGKGLEFYRTQSFAAAAQFFQKALVLEPTDGPSRAMLTRCREFAAHPPGVGWDGVSELGK
jgi:adenylate cyclase